ncbi:GNAT family N-acetyltransferase [Treponema sp.]|uniref:GNAT family N-acetyltransferase n=1 Tax=Treponema sp. TaxID=166 RepID=UPI00298DCA40|nr:GNAT family N-acetyltransferase [Treponema sp.]MCQ2242369.1 GNAT family N-acetyltransferase [Treponema sp.]
MMQIKYVENEDKDFWFTLDKHLPESEFEKKVRDRQGYVLTDDGIKIGLLRYNLFWDSIPFCTMLFVDWTKQKKGYGRQLMQFWEDDMKVQGYGMTMTSTRVDENAQHFYRKLGYKDCGGFTMEIPGYEQPMEMLMTKAL